MGFEPDRANVCISANTQKHGAVAKRKFCSSSYSFTTIFKQKIPD